MTAVRERRGGENSGAVVSPRFFAAPPRSTSSTTYCGVLPSSSRARKMFGRDAPRQPEKRSRFLAGQCQPIFPSATIFSRSPPSVSSRSSNRCSERVVSSLLLVPLFRSTARTCRANEKKIVFFVDESAREKSSSHDRRTSENSILSGLAESAARPARPPCRAMYIHPLSFPLPLFSLLSIAPYSYAVHIVNDTRWKPARHGRYRRHEYIFVILYFASRLSPGVSPGRLFGRSISVCRYRSTLGYIRSGIT